jgi:SAM-dependent methyltransferase
MGFNLDLRQLAPSLRQDENGIWLAGGGEPVSYPPHGNATYFQVEESSFWFQHRNVVLAAVLRHWPPTNGVLFDVGGGNGYVARVLQDLGITVVLVEPGPDGAANARRARGVTHVVCSRLQEVGFPPGSLPSVGLFDVLEHIQDHRRFLQEVHDLARPDSRLYLTVPAYRFLWSAEDNEAGHFRRYTRRSLSRVLTTAGFEVEYASYFFSMLPLPILLLRALPSRLGLRRKMTAKWTLVEHTNLASQSWLLRMLLRREQRRIESGRVLRFGGSIVAVARARG